MSHVGRRAMLWEAVGELCRRGRSFCYFLHHIAGQVAHAYGERSRASLPIRTVPTRCGSASRAWPGRSEGSRRRPVADVSRCMPASGGLRRALGNQKEHVSAVTSQCWGRHHWYQSGISRVSGMLVSSHGYQFQCFTRSRQVGRGTTIILCGASGTRYVSMRGLIGPRSNLQVTKEQPSILALPVST